ncbi:hypothetical protein CHT30_22945 [Salmonella enterica subsp. enterica serovar Infantis]|nr:hypothetical protein [Salmonella enterica subsp. enterica serovar Infantis]
MNSELVKEFSDSDINTMKLYLSDPKFNINTVDSKGRNALFYVNAKKTQFLIDSGINKDHQDNTGKTALFFSDYLKTVALIDSGVDVNICDNEGETALFHKPYEIAQAMIISGANVNKQNNKGRTALFSCDAKTVDILIEYGADINQLDLKSKNALYYSLFYKTEDRNNKIKKLLEYNIDHYGLDELLSRENRQYIEELQIMRSKETILNNLADIKLSESKKHNRL